MAIKVSGNTVIDDSRKGTFQGCNPGTYTNSNRPGSPNAGDIIYNTEEESLQVYDGEEWSGAGGGLPDIEGNDTAPGVGDSYTGSLQITVPNPGELVGRNGWMIAWEVPAGASGNGTLTIFNEETAVVAFSQSISTSTTLVELGEGFDFGAFIRYVIQVTYPGAAGVSYTGFVAVETTNESGFRVSNGQTYDAAGEYIISPTSTANSITVMTCYGGSGNTADGGSNDRPGNGGYGGSSYVKFVTMPVDYAKTNYPGTSANSVQIDNNYTSNIFNDSTYPATESIANGGRGGIRDNTVYGVAGDNHGSFITSLQAVLPAYEINNGNAGAGSGNPQSDGVNFGRGGGGGAGGFDIAPVSQNSISAPIVIPNAANGGQGGQGPSPDNRAGGYGGGAGTSNIASGGGGGGSGGESYGSYGYAGAGGSGQQAYSVVSEVTDYDYVPTARYIMQ